MRTAEEIAVLLYALIGRPTTVMDGGDPPPDIETVLQAEHAKTAEYRAQGILHELWLFADNKGALLLCEAETHKEAQAISAGYPMVQAGFVTHEIHALQSGMALEQHDGAAG